MKRDSIMLVRSIYRANRNVEKRQYLEEFLDIFEIMKLEVRLCADLKLISIKHLAELSKMLDIIGKQATAWKNKNNYAGIGQDTFCPSEQGFVEKGQPDSPATVGLLNYMLPESR